MIIFFISGSSESTFELHVAEIIYRNIASSTGIDIFDAIGRDIANVYSDGEGPTYSFPLNGSFFWTMADAPLANDQVHSDISLPLLN